MTTRTDYNGWTNRETWLINLHFEPRGKADLDFIKETLEQEVEAIQESIAYGNFFSDFINLGQINWYELEQHVEENYEEDTLFLIV